jgi:hypothetical protein
MEGLGVTLRVHEFACLEDLRVVERKDMMTTVFGEDGYGLPLFAYECEPILEFNH